LAVAQFRSRDDVKKLGDSWRLPHHDAAEPDLGSPPEVLRRHLRTEPDEPGADHQARRDKAWAAYKDQLGNAWRTNPRAATAIERQGENWRGGK
jgi:hypothetical protein